jgi:C-terminal novel E3 ligase, LRR-interacting
LVFLDKLALHHRSYPQAMLVDRLERIHKTVKKDSQLWDEVLTEAEEGSSACEDRALHYFLSIENRCLIYRLLNGETVDDKKMLEIMRSLYRREKLQKKVSQLIAQQGEIILAVHQPIQEPIDEIEIQLYCETKLKELLGFPGKDPHMRFEAIGKLHGQFLEQVAENLFQDEQVDPFELRDYITNNSYWQEYIEKKSHDELAAILKQYSQSLEQLDAKSATGAISSQAYQEKSKELMKNYQEACDNLIKDRSKKILQRLC